MMRPYKITLDAQNGFWVDLDSVLVIHDPFIPSRNPILRDNPAAITKYEPFSFSITLAFQDKPKVVEIFDAGAIDRMINEHAMFVEAWSAR